MRICLYEAAGDRGPELGMATEAGVVAAGAALPGLDGGAALKEAIGRFDELRPELERLAGSAGALPLGQVRLLPPLAQPAKIACCTRMQGTDREGDLYFFLKASGSTLGSDGEIQLPALEDADLFTHNVHIAVVIGTPVHRLDPARWREAVFGYTAMIDVTARNTEMARWKDGKSPLGSSCDTFTPLGPWIVPRSDVDESGGLHISLRCRGELRQEDRFVRLDEEIGEAIELVSTVMTLRRRRRDRNRRVPTRPGTDSGRRADRGRLRSGRSTRGHGLGPGAAQLGSDTTDRPRKRTQRHLGSASKRAGQGLSSVAEDGDRAYRRSGAAADLQRQAEKLKPLTDDRREVGQVLVVGDAALAAHQMDGVDQGPRGCRGSEHRPRTP